MLDITVSLNWLGDLGLVIISKFDQPKRVNVRRKWGYQCIVSWAAKAEYKFNNKGGLTAAVAITLFWIN